MIRVSRLLISGTRTWGLNPKWDNTTNTDSNPEEDPFQRLQKLTVKQLEKGYLDEMFEDEKFYVSSPRLKQWAQRNYLQVGAGSGILLTL